MFIFAPVEKEEQQYLYESIGNEIKKLRIKSRFSQEQLAHKLKLSRASVVNIEKGRQHPPLHLLIDISRVLNINFSSLINDELIIDSKSTVKDKDLKKRISKSIDSIDQNKVLAFIKQATNSSKV